MADEETTLTEEQLNKAVEAVTRHQVGEIVCPICKSNKWEVGNHLVQPITLNRQHQSMMFGGVGYPLVMLISTKCGYTMFINAVRAGVVSDKLEPSAATPEEAGDKNG